MPEIILRLRVWDNSSSKKVDSIWQRAVTTGFLPAKGDDVELWDCGPLAPVMRRWWRADDGRTVALVAELIINAPNPSAATGDDGRLKWVPWSWRHDQEHPGALLRMAGWEVLTDG